MENQDFGKIYYSPTVDVDQFYNFHFYGEAEQSISLFDGNMDFYAKGSVYYYSGGNDLSWCQEFQTTGLTKSGSYTNEPLSFSAKIGFRVASLHMFYQFNNIENRQFSVMQNLPLQYRIDVLGVEWYFKN